MKLNLLQLYRCGIIFTKLQADDIIYYNRDSLSIGLLRPDVDELYPLKIDGQKEFHLDSLDRTNFERIVKIISALTGLAYEPFQLKFAGMTRNRAFRFKIP